MTTGPTPEDAKKQLDLAEQALSDATYLIAGHRLKAATNRAYYAMFHVALATLATANVKPPKSHSGTINLFGRHFVTTGRVEKRFARFLRDAANLRMDADYDVYASVDGDPGHGHGPGRPGVRGGQSRTFWPGKPPVDGGGGAGYARARTYSPSGLTL